MKLIEKELPQTPEYFCITITVLVHSKKVARLWPPYWYISEIGVKIPIKGRQGVSPIPGEQCHLSIKTFLLFWGWSEKGSTVKQLRRQLSSFVILYVCITMPPPPPSLLGWDSESETNTVINNGMKQWSIALLFTSELAVCIHWVTTHQTNATWHKICPWVTDNVKQDLKGPHLKECALYLPPTS